MGSNFFCLLAISPNLLGRTAAAAGQGNQSQDGSVLPFPDAVSGSKAGRTMQASTYSPLPTQQRLPKGAPNVLIILLDDAGPALASAFGGDIRTPTLDRLAKSGVSFNRFHTTAMCSPTRGALLTGRNHHALGQGDKADLKRTVPLAFTASETFDVGIDLGSPVSLDYLDRRPFAFTGIIEKINVELR